MHHSHKICAVFAHPNLVKNEAQYNIVGDVIYLVGSFDVGGAIEPPADSPRDFERRFFRLATASDPPTNEQITTIRHQSQFKLDRYKTQIESTIPSSISESSPSSSISMASDLVLFLALLSLAGPRGITG